jgi:predicted O-methyltransferase YrrM
MPLDQQFMSVAREAFSPTMGTENMAPLLYSLVRFNRPRSILEIGAGYTTLFLLQAMADNYNDYRSEIERLAALEKSPPEERQRAIKDTFPLMLQDYYRQPYEPMLHCVDNMSHAETSAHKALAGAKVLGIDRHLKFHQENSRDFIARLKDRPMQFDMMWLDAGNYASYVDYGRNLFPFINPDGGLILIHSTETNLEAQAYVRSLKVRQATVDFSNFEMIGLLEPHKFRQNSVMILRVTSGMPDRIYTQTA